MKRFLAASLAIAMVIPLSSKADEAKVLNAKQTIEINADAKDVWSNVSNFGDMGVWHPAVKKTEIVEGTNNKKGAVRVLTLQDDGTIKEKLTAYNAKSKSFTYKILEGVLPVSSYVSTLNVKAGKKDMTTVTWQGNFKRKDTSATPTKGQGDEDAITAITGVYKGGLENLKKISETK